MPAVHAFADDRLVRRPCIPDLVLSGIDTSDRST
jgi:hypothetical protein